MLCALGVFGLLLSVTQSATAQARPQWGNLDSGSFSVGFRAEWRLDYSRTYRTIGKHEGLYGTDKAPRPILMNVWYPAQPRTGRPMVHGGYFDIAAVDPTIASLAAALSTHARDIAASEALKTPVGNFTDADRTAIDAFLQTPIASWRDARPAAGRFPLVVYHAGAGSSFDDNAVFCEYLASHGYVVVGSAFLDQGGDTLSVDGGDGSAADIRFLIAEAREWTNVDWRKIGLAGHSLGAQASLFYQASGASAVDAIISLDTTYDMHSLITDAWGLRVRVADNIGRMTVPVLIAAPREAVFQLADRFDRTERYYLTVTQLGHNDYIAQGILGAELRGRLNEQAGGARTVVEKVRTLRGEYEQIVRASRMFFDGYLKGSSDSLADLRKLGDGDWAAPTPVVEYLPSGRTSPSPYQASNTAPPSPRQLRLMGEQQGAAAASALLTRFWRQGSSHPNYARSFAAIWLNELIATGKPTAATALFETYRALDSQLGVRIESQLMYWGELFTRVGRHEVARLWLRSVVTINPAHAEAAAKLAEIETKLGKR